MTVFLNLLSLLGSLGLFLFGMKTMSEGLEKFAGDRLRNILAAMTRNRVMGVLTGLSVTALIQSSSATTVMVVSFVNAGLMSLAQAIGVIMGANIGTTVTAWIISFVGFKVDIAALALPLLAVGIPLVFSDSSRRKSIGEFLYGFAFLFMGLNLLQQSAQSLDVGTMVAHLLASVSGGGYLTILLFVVVGALVTVLVQSSSAAMAITLMLFDMNIPGFGLAQAAALAMGQNIGTTVTAVIASLTANTQARRAALAHMFFNVFGVCVVLVVFYPFCHGVEWFVAEVMNASGNKLFELSAFHTAFNVVNTLILIWFVPQIERLVCRLMPDHSASEKRLHFISGGLLSTAELSLFQARSEVGVMARRCHRMVEMLRDALAAERDAEFNDAYERLEHYEQITDNMESEIGDYLRQVAEGRLSAKSKHHIACMLRQIDELESVGDSMFHLGRTLLHKRRNEPQPFTLWQVQRMTEMLGLVDTALSQMRDVLDEPSQSAPDLTSHYVTEQAINDLRTSCRAANIEAVNSGEYGYRLGVFFNDFIAECEKVGDYVINTVQEEASKEENGPRKAE